MQHSSRCFSTSKHSCESNIRLLEISSESIGSSCCSTESFRYSESNECLESSSEGLLELIPSFISCIPYLLLNIFSKFVCGLFLVKPLFYSFT
nr:MAG TPA: hypothetical protein [Caudoviricetes sp.]